MTPTLALDISDESLEKARIAIAQAAAALDDDRLVVIFRAVQQAITSLELAEPFSALSRFRRSVGEIGREACAALLAIQDRRNALRAQSLARRRRGYGRRRHALARVARINPEQAS